MSSVDERVVQLRMENNQFEREAATTMNTLSKLSSAFGSFGSSIGKDVDFSEIQRGINSVSFGALQNGIDATVSHFNKLEVVATDALLRIARKAEDVAVNMVKSLSIDQIGAGLTEYEMKLDTIQVILANTQGANTLDEVKDRLEELNRYADKTIYNFGQMTQNIGRFTAAGVNLDDSVTAIKGLSNLSALVGANSEQNSRAMYNLSQALSVGKMQLLDWRSFENAGGLGGKVFRDELIKTADELGKFGKAWSTAGGETIEGAALMRQAMGEDGGAFRETLKYGWVDNDVMITTLQKFADETTELGQQAYEAATKVRTFTKLMDTLRESVQSGWAETWEIIIGDYEDAPNMWGKVNDVVGGYLEKQAKARNADLEAWASYGGREQIINGISNAYEALSIILGRLGDVFDRIFSPDRLATLSAFSAKFESITGTVLGWVKAADNALAPTQKQIDTAIDKYEIIKEHLDKFDGIYDKLVPDGKNVRTSFGNLDVLKRKTLEYSEALREASDAALETWRGPEQSEVRGHYKLYDGINRFGFDSIKEGVEVSFTPILETESGLEVLTKSTVTDYINTLIEKSIDATGQVDKIKLFEIDKSGFDVYGKHVHGLIAGIGEEANDVHLMLDTIAAEDTDTVLETFNTLSKIGYLGSDGHTDQQLRKDIKSTKKYNKATDKLNKSASKLQEVLDQIFTANYGEDERLKALQDALSADDSFLSANPRDAFSELLKQNLVDLKKYSDKELKILGFTDRQIDSMRSGYAGPGYDKIDGSAEQLRAEQKEIREIVRESKDDTEELEESEEEAEKPLDHFAQMVVNFFAAYEEVMNIVHELWDDFIKLKDTAVQVVKDIAEGFDYGVSSEEFTNVAHNIVGRITEIVNAVQAFVNQPEIRDKIIEISSGFFSFFGILMKFKMAKWQIMISVFQYLITNIGPAVVDAFHKIGRAFNELNAELGITNIINEVAGAISGFFDDSQAAKTFGETVSAAIGLIADGIVWLIGVVKDLVGIISQLDVTPILDFVRGLDFSGLTNWFKGFDLKELASTLNEKGLIGLFSEFFENIKTFFTKDIIAGVAGLAGEDGAFGLITLFNNVVANINNFFSSLTLTGIKDKIVELFIGKKGHSKYGISNYQNDVNETIEDIKNNFANSLNGTATEVESSSGGIIGSIMDGIITALTTGLTVFAGRVGALFSHIKNNFWEFIKDLLGIRLTLLTIVQDIIGVKVVLSIAKAIRNIGTALRTFGGLTAPLDAIKETIETFGEGLKVEKFRNIAISIGIVAAAAVALAMVPTGNLVKAGIAIGAIGGMITGFLYLINRVLPAVETGDKNPLSKFISELIPRDATKTFRNVALAFGAFSIGIGLLAHAIKTLGTLDFLQLVQGIGALAVVMGLIAGATKIFDKFKVSFKSIYSLAGAIISLSVALTMLILPLFILGKIPLLNLVQGMFAIVGAIGLFAGAAKVLSSKKVNFNVEYFLVLFGLATNIMAFSIALTALVVPLAALSLIPIDKLVKAFGSLAVALGLFAGLSVVLKRIKYDFLSFLSMTGFAVNILALSVAFTALTVPLIALSLLPFGSMIKSIGIIIIALSAIIGLSKLLGRIKFGIDEFIRLIALSGGIVALSVALTTLIIPLFALSLIPFAKILKGLFGIALALALLLGAAKLINKLKLDNISIAVFGKLALSMIMVSAAAVALSIAIVAVTAAIKYLVKTVITGLAAVVNFFAALFGAEEVFAAELDDTVDNFNVADDIKNIAKENTDAVKNGVNSVKDGLTGSLNDTFSGTESEITSGFDNLLGSLGGISLGPGIDSVLGTLTEPLAGLGGNIDGLMSNGLSSIPNAIEGLDLTGYGDMAMNPFNNELGSWGSIFGSTTEGNVDNIVNSLGSSIQASIPTIENQGASIFDALLNGASGSSGSAGYTHMWEKLEKDAFYGVDLGNGYKRALDPDHYIDVEENGQKIRKAIYAGVRSAYVDADGVHDEILRVWMDEAGNVMPQVQELASFNLASEQKGSLFDNIGGMIKEKVSTSVAKEGGIMGMLGALFGGEGDNGWDSVGTELKNKFDGTIEKAGGIKGILGSLFGEGDGEDGWASVETSLTKKASELGKTFGDSLKDSFTASIGEFFANIYTSMRQWLNGDDSYKVEFDPETGFFNEVPNLDRAIPEEEVLEKLYNNTPDAIAVFTEFARQNNLQLEDITKYVEKAQEYGQTLEMINNTGPMSWLSDIGTWFGNLFSHEVGAAELTPEEQAALYTKPLDTVVNTVNEQTTGIILKAEQNSATNSESLANALTLPPAPTDPATAASDFVGPIQQQTDAVQKATEVVIKEVESRKVENVGKLKDALTIRSEDLSTEGGVAVQEEGAAITDGVKDGIVTESVSAMAEAANTVLSNVATGIKNYLSAHIPPACQTVVDALSNSIKNDSSTDMPSVSNHVVSIFSENTKSEAAIQGPDTGATITNEIVNGAVNQANAASGNVGNAIVSGIINTALSADNRKILGDAGVAIANELLNASKNTLGIASPSKEYAAITDFSIMGLVNEVKNKLSVVAGAGQEIGGTFMDAYADMMERVNLAMNTDATPTITPVLDLSRIQNDAGVIDSLLNRDSLAMANDVSYSFNERQNAVLDSRNFPTPINYREDLYSLHNDIAGLNQTIASLNLVLDSGQLVGGLRSQMNASLGATAARRIRGL